MKPQYPSIDSSFIIEKILSCENIIPEPIIIGDTYTFVEKGSRAINKRQITFRQSKKKEVTFDRATAIAIRCKFVPELVDWLKEHRNYHSGGYTVPSK